MGNAADKISACLKLCDELTKAIDQGERGLNHNHDHDLKNLLQGAAISAIERPGPLQDFYAARVEKGIRRSLARLALARKIAAIPLIIWKKGVSFDPKQLQRQAA